MKRKIKKLTAVVLTSWIAVAWLVGTVRVQAAEMFWKKKVGVDLSAGAIDWQDGEDQGKLPQSRVNASAGEKTTGNEEQPVRDIQPTLSAEVREADTKALAEAGAVSWGETIYVNWDEVKEELELMGARENLDILTGITFTVPAEILEFAADANKTIACHVGNSLGPNLCFSIPARKNQSFSEDLQIHVEADRQIPQRVLDNLGQDASFVFPLQIGEKVLFPVELNLHFSLGEENAGKAAVLYAYDNLMGELRYVEAYRVTENGEAMFGIRRGDEYVLAVTDEIPYGAVVNYTVAPGDTLCGIAKQFGLSLGNLLGENEQIQEADRIYAGQILKIPGRK